MREFSSLLACLYQKLPVMIEIYVSWSPQCIVLFLNILYTLVSMYMNSESFYFVVDFLGFLSVFINLCTLWSYLFFNNSPKNRDLIKALNISFIAHLPGKVYWYSNIFQVEPGVQFENNLTCTACSSLEYTCLYLFLWSLLHQLIFY